ncbi:MAG TPA: HdeA/HdeB family chaperone [Xanthobacteraceae bacterium]|nr:HdeA/HdeB family chaperone [Xanthobacteraceae bacterium]
MKLSIAALAIVALAWSAPARADDIDLSNWTCKRFLDANSADVNIILAWLDGYYKDEDDPPVIHTQDFFANSKKLRDYCAAHPDMGFIAATDALFERE